MGIERTCRQSVRRPACRSGAVLMEVVFALSLFFVGAVFVMNGLNGSVRAVNNIKLEADAADLAVTTFSEVQMGLTPLQSVGPVGVAYAGGEGWTYELIVSSLEDTLELPQLKKLEIVVRNEAGEFAYRTTHLVWDNPNPQPAVPGIDQIPSDLAGGGDMGGLGDALGGALGGGAAGGGAAGGGAAGGRPSLGNLPDVTPRFPQGGNGNGGDATPRFPQGGQRPGGNGNGGDATPRFPQGGQRPGGNGNGGDATPRFPQGGQRPGSNGNGGDATPRFPQGGGRGNGGNNGGGNPPAPPQTPPDLENLDPENPPQRGNGGGQRGGGR